MSEALQHPQSCESRLTQLEALIHQPFALAHMANQARAQGVFAKEGALVQLRLWSQPELAGLDLELTDADPSCPQLRAHAGALSVKVPSESTPQRHAFLNWLRRALDQDPAWTHLCVHSQAPSSTQRNWLLACARILAPASLRIEARVDLVGPRSAQLALNFGADTLASPVASQKRLPLAGVASPHENSRTGLATLIEQAGYVPAAPSPAQTS